MAKTYNRMMIDVNKDILSGVTAVKGDSESRYLDVNLYSNGLAIDLTGHTVRLDAKTDNEEPFFEFGEITEPKNGRCQFELKSSLTSSVGNVELQITIYKNNTEVLSTRPFKLYVWPTIRNDEAIEAKNEYGTLVIVFQEIQDALDTMHAIQENFGSAGEIAAEYGATTFWEMLEALANSTDFRAIIDDVVKESLNSTLGTDGFEPLDEMIKGIYGGRAVFDTPGEYVLDLPTIVTALRITACGGGGAGGNGSSNTSQVYNGSDGESTVIGGIVTLQGGRGNNGITGGASTGYGSGKGGNYGVAGSDGILGTGGAAGGSGVRFGGGGGASIGSGGDGGSTGKSGTRGAGGGGGGSTSSAGYGAGGGSGAVAVHRQVFKRSNSEPIQIKVGAGGKANPTQGTNSYKGGDGGDGYVEIEWGLAAL